ncbi:deoxyuridine 5'-triphosphate nucleotidohydrolase-like [Schistocerca cancellata]|uniref:deoxyuridine 5'-triphosphate nucleotidohydrolase-like n=1 Tax=Schistocerca cancellata TaxID=274614 RepID=UPI002119B202|nr:deoxyuridine 5'-triphosphate nucleotidohydrolase-like [Schistocerca cancellata]
MAGRRNAILKFVKLTENAFSPIKLSPKSAGYDLRSAYDLCVPPHGKELVKIDIKVQLPEGCYGRIAPRSGIALNYHIDIGAGVIDEDYRGNIGVVLFNHSDKEFVVKRGDRIAQLICEQILYPELEEVQELDDTERGSMGLGSTGIK